MRSILVTTVAAAALIGCAAVADPGQGKGNGGHGNGNPAKGGNKHAGGPAKGNGGPGTGSPGKTPKTAERFAPQKIERRVERKVREAKMPPGQAKKAERVVSQSRTIREPARAVERRVVERADFDNRDNAVRAFGGNDRVISRERDFRWATLNRADHVFKGCPPGLAKKNNGCTPPGLDRADNRAWYAPNWYNVNVAPSWRYRDGYMVRYDSDRIVDYVPLLGGALAVGHTWPGSYQPVSLPPYYENYYGLDRYGSYRYYDDAIYGVDPKTQAITAVVALLTGQDFTIGEQMPAGFDIYNVPYQYRDRYHDTPDAMYRYNDGYVYQVDPTTRLVQAAIELIA